MRISLKKIISDNLPKLKNLNKETFKEIEKDEKKKDSVVSRLLDIFIDNLVIKLPRPTNYSEGSNLKAALADYKAMVDEFVDSVMSDEMLSSDLLGEGMAEKIQPTREIIKKMLMIEWIHSNNHLPAMADFLTLDEDGESNNNLLTKHIDMTKTLSKLFMDYYDKNSKEIKENNKEIEKIDDKYNNEESEEEAIDKLRNINVDLILMDLRMPIMNGYEATNIIKNSDKLKHIPIIALTASVMGKDLEKVSEFGFNGYLRKPVILDDLIEELAKYLKFHFISKQIIENDNPIIIDLIKLKFVLNKLNNELKEEWKNIKDGGDFSLIEEFAQKLNNLAVQEEIYILKDYSQELIKNLNSFDIEKVDYLMNIYLELIEKLKGKIGNK